MFKPNRLLVNLVEKIQPAGPSDVQPEKEELSCLRYQQKFCYFWEIPFDMLWIRRPQIPQHCFDRSFPELSGRCLVSFPVLPSDQEFSEDLRVITSSLRQFSQPKTWIQRSKFGELMPGEIEAYWRMKRTWSHTFGLKFRLLSLLYDLQGITLPLWASAASPFKWAK